MCKLPCWDQHMSTALFTIFHYLWMLGLFYVFFLGFQFSGFKIVADIQTKNPESYFTLLK